MRPVIKLALIILVLSWTPVVAIAEKAGAKLNWRAREDLPYLWQHAMHPVDWYPWGKKRLRRLVRKTSRFCCRLVAPPCHWCHVMERESLSNKEIADVLNKSFVAIEVD